MDKQYEKQYHELEKTHWWFVSRRRKLLSLLHLSPEKTYLDIGCSSGVLLQEMLENGACYVNVYGVDISPEGIQRCQSKGLKNTYVMDATHLDLPENYFDYIIASDCLEHIHDDCTALKNWYRALKPGGVIIVFVPAYQFLWSLHDVVNHHHRRYTHAELYKKFKAAGFSVRRTGYWNFTLFFPIALFRLLRNGMSRLGFGEGTPVADLKSTSAPINTLLKALLSIENRVMEMIRLPIGVSTFCISEKAHR